MPSSEPIASHDLTVARDLALLGLPSANWPAEVAGPDGRKVADVAVVGAGMNGIAAAGALVLKGVRNIRVLDRAMPGQEGPWLSYARMETLRSPKELTGPALGIPSLTFQAWYRACHGDAAWEALYKIPNADWAAYLSWLQRVLRLPVEHGIEVRRVQPDGRFIRLETVTSAGEATSWARRVVLATGRGGAGGFHVPGFVDPSLWPDIAAHTNEGIDFAALAGKRIAVIGGGASAWDNAAIALETGAARVDMFVRRPFLPQVNKGRGSAYPGFLHGFAALDDADRWALHVYTNDLQPPPPHETVHRTLRNPGFHIHFASPVTGVRRAGQKVAVTVAGRPEEELFDFAIVATGFAMDVARIAELAGLGDSIARWADRYTPPPELRRPEIAAFPYLGPGFELTERAPGAAPGLSQIHLFNYGAHASHWGIASDIPGVSIAAERLSQAIVAALFREDRRHVRQRLEAFDEPELQGTPFFVPSHEETP